jgi:hypothetical protein
MVFIVDSTDVFDAPVDEVWSYLSAPREHQAAHGHWKVMRRRLGPRSGRYSWNQTFAGRPTRFAMRWTSYHPTGIAYRVERGPFQGSTFFLYYVPRGDRTAVTIVGEFVSPTLPRGRLRSAVGRFFAREFREDHEAIRRRALPRRAPVRARVAKRTPRARSARARRP